MEEDQYLTIATEATGVYKEKGSKFIALALPAGSVEEVKTHLERVRKQYHDARHHCYAYKIGHDQPEYRYNDAGEPSGTAGKPIYGQIESFGLSNLLIVVVRYFGGVKLGTGGLIQAYRAAARDALEQSEREVRTIHRALSLNFPYPAMNDVMRIIKEEELEMKNQEFTLEGNISVSVRLSRYAQVRDRFMAIEGVAVSEGAFC